MDSIPIGLIVLVGLAFLALWYFDRRPDRPAHVAPRLADLGALNQAESGEIRETTAAILTASARVQKIQARMNYDHSDYSQGAIFRSSEQTPWEQALAAAQEGLRVAQWHLELPPILLSDPPIPQRTWYEDKPCPPELFTAHQADHRRMPGSDVWYCNQCTETRAIAATRASIAASEATRTLHEANDRPDA